MKLTLETVRIMDLQFGSNTCLKNGVLFVNMDDIISIAESEPVFNTLKMTSPAQETAPDN